MKISTKGRYALRMLLDMALNQGDGYVTLKDIAERQGMSKKYLEQIVPLLNRNEILQTSRGFRGGYRLLKSPDNYTVGDILRVTEGGLAPVSCMEHDPNPCERCEYCATLPVWKGLYKAINEYLDSITLRDILDNRAEMIANNYVI